MDFLELIVKQERERIQSRENENATEKTGDVEKEDNGGRGAKTDGIAKPSERKELVTSIQKKPLTQSDLSQMPFWRAPSERGKFTVLPEGEIPLSKEEIMDYQFTMENIKELFHDGFVTAHFLAQFGIIPNKRRCPVNGCPQDLWMSLIKHSNGYVWRCRSCRKRREGRLITKVSVFDSTFLFYSRMPLAKLFTFMNTWALNPGCTPSTYNMMLGENRLVEETVNNTIMFLRENLQLWMSVKQLPAEVKIGTSGGIVELIYTMSCGEMLTGGRSNRGSRRERKLEPTIILFCLKTEQWKVIKLDEDLDKHNNHILVDIFQEHVQDHCTVAMKDRLMDQIGEEEALIKMNLCLSAQNIHCCTIADQWNNFGKEEREKQAIKTIIEKFHTVPNSGQENYPFEYVFRRMYTGKPIFNGLLTVFRELNEFRMEHGLPGTLPLGEPTGTGGGGGDENYAMEQEDVIDGKVPKTKETA